MADVNPPGPVQAYVAPATTGVERFSVAPVHNGPLLVAAGVAGNGLTTTVVDPAALVHPPTVIVTLYVPASVGYIGYSWITYGRCKSTRSCPGICCSGNNWCRKI